jgi:hypothetical protein
MAIIDKGKLLASGSPADAERQLEGRVWTKSMSKQDLSNRTWTFPILSTKLVGGLPSVRIYCESQPDGGWKPVDPDLEDVFFSKLSGVLAS